MAGKIDPNKALEIINALKDGRINQKEAQVLGLTPKEAEELNKAFSMGEAHIGDYVLVNKGRTPDGKKQITETRKDDYLADLKEFGKGVYDFFIGRRVQYAKNIAKPVYDAVKNDGNLGEALGKSAKAYGEAVVDNAVTAAKVVFLPFGALASCSPDDSSTVINQSGVLTATLNINQDSSVKEILEGMKKIENAIETSNKTQAENHEETQIQLKELNTELKRLENLLIQQLEQQIKNGASIDELVKYAKQTGIQLDEIIGLLTENNELLKGIKADGNRNSEEILKAIYAVKGSVDNLQNIVNNLPANMKAEFKADLDAILAAIKGNGTKIDQLKDTIQSLAAKIYARLGDVYDQTKANGKTQNDIKVLLENLMSKDINYPDNTQALLDILEVLKSIDLTTKDTNKAVKDIKNDLAEYFRADAYFKSQLMNAMDKMQGTEEQQNALLTEILEAIKTLGTDNKNYYLGIINEMSKNGAKMDDVIALLKTINENVVKGNKQNKEYGDAIIALLAKLGDSSAATLNAILKNGTKLDDILAILKVINGNVVDGNKITENYGKQILEAIKTGNGKLDDIKKLVEHIDNDIHEFKENAQKMGEAIIEAINKKKCGGSIDMTAILNKLDEILAAIKDHKVDVTVDVTGKVECNCNCGSKHEGILGELNSMIN